MFRPVCRPPVGLLSVVALSLTWLSTGVRAGEPKPAEEPAVVWQTNYRLAMEAAEQRRRMLVVLFYEPGKNRLVKRFEEETLADASVRAKLGDCVCLRLPCDARITVGGEQVVVLEHPAFGAMSGGQGVAILDFAHRGSPYYGRLVSALPFSQTHFYSARQLKEALDLPPGTVERRRIWLLDRLRRNCPPVAGHKPGEPESPVDRPREIEWLTDYYLAVDLARRQRRMLLIFFCQPGGQQPCNRFEAETLADPQVRERLRDYLCLRLPLDAKVDVDGKPQKLLEHPSFREMLGRPGIAVLDYAHREASYYGRVVSVFPITEKLWYTPERLAVILELPPGTLTQRTMIYAVRIHPDHPASTQGRPDDMLFEEARKQSQYQADIRLQGHHQWETRFHRITARLPSGLSASEVCAESWPGENLVEAAIECVRCWRLSDGHWSAVREFQPVYGYDIKRGSNGVWYATGIFGRRR
jgi:hypothetical protein